MSSLFLIRQLKKSFFLFWLTKSLFLYSLKNSPVALFLVSAFTRKTKNWKPIFGKGFCFLGWSQNRFVRVPPTKWKKDDFFSSNHYILYRCFCMKKVQFCQKIEKFYHLNRNKKCKIDFKLSYSFPREKRLFIYDWNRPAKTALQVSAFTRKTKN